MRIATMPGRLSHLLLSAIVLAGAPALAAAPPAAQPPLEVAQWRWTEGIEDRQPVGNYQRFAPDQPLTLWFEVHGTQAALDALRAGHPLRVVVRWHRVNGATPGAPDLATVLPIGAPGLADRLEHEIRGQGHFDWPAWARKNTLSAGRWEVSLTDPDGYPLPCATPRGPCRFTIDIG
jgi:hypothetical protein